MVSSSPNLRPIASRYAERIDPAVFALRMGVRLDGWQAAVTRQERRQVIILCSRQAGKSYAVAIRALHRAEFYPGSTIIIAAPAERQAKLMLKVIKDLYKRYPNRRKAKKWNEMSVEFANGSEIEAVPGLEKTLRGYSAIDLLILDEAARVPNALYHALRPILATSNGDLILLSTPFGKRGFFYDTWQASETDPAWQRIGPVTAEMVPRITEEFLAEERRSIPISMYRQEYGCVFTDQIGAIFRMDQIQAALLDTAIVPLFQNPRQEPLFDRSIQPLRVG